MVKAEGVHKSFGAAHILKGIDLEVAPREVFCLIGPSGSGKSTFLRCINHLEKVSSRGCPSTANWSATASTTASSTSCATGRSPPAAAISAWSSSASTSSRT